MDTAENTLVLGAPAPEDTVYFIQASTSMVERRPRILKHGDTFGMFDPFGDILPAADKAEGLYHRDTRHLSGFQVLIAGRSPLLLSSTVLLNNAELKCDLTNPDIFDGGRLVLPQDALHLSRTKFLWQAAAHERLAIRNFAAEILEFDVDLAFAADFADIFEVRGFRRSEFGQKAARVEAPDRVRIDYHGLDGVGRSTVLVFDPAPDHLSESEARYRLALEPGQARSAFVTVLLNAEGEPARAPASFFNALKQARRPIREVARRSTAVETSNAIANEVLCRSMADLTMLATETADGAYPYAGVPWFSTAFGRDGLITALLMLWVDPALARGVLGVLAATQAEAEDPAADAEPGKILHETRDGELSRLGQVPFRHYYGTIDATPLFVVLAGAYLERTGDLATVRRLYPHVQRALAWMERHGDRDGDGLIEYGRRRHDGLINQGWKDSHDSVFHASGELATGPIALVEVQGYAYAAYRAAAALARALGEPVEAAQRDRQADQLRALVEQRFWSDALGFYALALDGDKRPCAVRSSNAGQLLLTGLPAADRAGAVARALLQPEFFTGFGIRTVAAGEARYNPMSYHNGSIWPHDNALIALGLGRYGHKEAALRVLDGLYDAAGFMSLRRLPELFCGFRRRPSTAPTLYPVACSPQAWASAAPFALLQAALGLGFDPAQGLIRLDRPRLPASLDTVNLRNLQLNGATVDVQIRRVGEDVAVNVLRRRGDIRVDIVL